MFGIISHPVYKELTAYAKKMYLFLMSHSEKIRKMGLDKWRAPLGVSEDLCLKEFKRKVMEAIRELVSFNVLDSSSHINNQNEVCTTICDAAWQSKPIFTPNHALSA